ncbi:MAG TPA: glycosyltransferase family 4 protein [Candidatus Dormibacteraeota bacterium]|nr:glycosyltransferase family 4 protein [Candidatus Dormibacteraeota bacterium]
MARIALVHDVAGVAEVQAEILRRAGHDVDHIRLPDFGARWPWLAKALTLPIRVLLYLPTVRRLRRGRYDAIHIHWVPRGIIGLLTGRRFLVQAHGSDLHKAINTPGLSSLNRRVLERARVIFYVTPNLEPYIHRFADRARYLPNPIDVRSPAPRARAPEGVRRVVIFTRLDPVKGVERIFPAVERLSQIVEVTALAWGPLARDYTARYRGFVNFVDLVPHEQVTEFLEQFDLVVGQMEQGILSLSELEAMAAGKPLITGIDRDLYPGDKPPVVSSDNPDQLVAQVEALHGDVKRLADLAREGREWVRRNHSYERHLGLLEAAYFGAPAREMPMAM